MEIVTLRHSRCFENGNDDFGVEAFWAIHCAHWSSGFMVLNAALYLIGDAARVGYFVPINGPLNGHPPSTLQTLIIFGGGGGVSENGLVFDLRPGG